MKKLTEYITESFGENIKKTNIKGYHDKTTLIYNDKSVWHNKVSSVLGEVNRIGFHYFLDQAGMIIRVRTSRPMELVLFPIRKDDPIYSVAKSTGKSKDEVILRCAFDRKHSGAKSNMTLIKYKPKSGAIYFLDGDYENDNSLVFEKKQVQITRYDFEYKFFEALNKHIGY